jgi:methyl-accepting chemotaxis protein
MGVIFVVTISFFFYRSRVTQIIRERVVTLEVLANTIAGPSWTVANEWTWYPGTIENIIQSVLKTPGIKFVRIIDDEDKTIKKSTDEKELGKKISNLPVFGREVALRDELYNNKPIKGLSIKAKDGSNLWMGVSFEETKKENLYSTAIVTLITIILFTFTIIGTFLLVRRIMIRPLLLLMDSFEKLKNKEYKTRLGNFFINEVNQVFGSFDYMAEELGKFHANLENSKKFLETQVDKRTKELKELTQKQEKIIEERTRDLKDKMTDMERFQKFAVGRELKMVELKNEIKKIKNKKI